MDPAADVIDFYRRHGLTWHRDRDRGSVETAWFNRFLALIPSGGTTVLDLGCGAGTPVARHFLDAGLSVTGIDTAPDLLALARQRCPEGEWIEADMRTLALGRRFAGILAWNSFFHLRPDDQRRMVAVFQAHAAPGAPLLFTSGPAAGEAVGTLFGNPLYHASLDPADYRALLTAHGFAERHHIAEDPACYGLTVWLAQAR